MAKRPLLCRFGRHDWRQQSWHVSYCRRCPATKAFDTVAQRERIYRNVERRR